MFSNSLICKIIKYIDNNINAKICIEDLEKRFFYNRYYIMKLFKKETNITIVDYINSLRIYNSILDIKNCKSSLLNIAFKNGFYSIEYFSETFKKIVGVNPQIVRKYFRNNYVNLEQAKAINTALIELYTLKQFKEKYLLNQKPITSPVKKLSIFK